MVSQQAERGTRFEQYRILEPLGEGGMGEVCLAVDETLDRKVALKTIRAEQRLDPALQARFLREARILSSLDHPGICRIYDYLRTAESDVLVLEYIEGAPLDRAIHKGVDFRTALGLAVQLCDALGAAHAAGVIHRDLKPANILVTKDGQARILDFGLARSPAPPGTETPAAPQENPTKMEVGGQATVIHLFDDAQPDTAELTLAGSIMGTVAYMAPEQATGAPVTTASDCYSLGLVLQELFTGQAALEPKRDLMATLAAARASELRPIEGLDGEATRLVAGLLRSAPAERTTAREAEAGLRRILERPKRRIRQALVGSVLLAGALGTWKYTVDLKEQRDEASAAREVAENRTRQAEGLIENALSTMVPPLSDIDQLGVMRPFVESAQGYFRSIDEEQLTRGELVHYAQLRTLVGGVESSLGNRASALEHYESARDLAAALTRAEPNDPDAWLQLGDAHFYVAEMLSLDGRPEEALEQQRRYLTAAQTQLELQPGDRFARTNVGWAQNAVGAAWLQLGQVREAEAAMGESERVFEALYAEDPADLEAAASLADARSWLGSSALRRGDLDGAVSAFRRELEARHEIAGDSLEGGFEWRTLSYARTHLIRALQLNVQPAEALPLCDAAVEDSRARCANDPDNLTKRYELAVNLIQQGQTRSGARAAQAREPLRESVQLLRDLLRSDEANPKWRGHLRVGLLELAWLAFDDESQAQARALVDEALAASKGALDAGAESALQAASLALLEGQLLRVEGGEARAPLERALEHLAEADTSPEHRWFALQLRARAHLLLGQRESAEPILAQLRANERIDRRLAALLD